MAAVRGAGWIVAILAVIAFGYACTTMGPKDLPAQVCAGADQHDYCLHRGTTTVAHR